MKCFGLDAASRAAVEISGDAVIHQVEEIISAPAAAAWLAPGFIDLQVNGFAGVDYNDPSASLEAIGLSLRRQFATGITRLFPTIITGSFENTTGCLRNLVRARRELPFGHAMEAFHVEGPHISPEDGPRGAHPREHVRPPDFDEYRRWQDAAEGLVRLVTIAPEWPGAPAYIEALVREGVVVSIGHTAAGRDHIRAAISAGATLSTHIGNGSHSVLPRHPNYVWEQLADDRLTATLICDGIHLGEAFMRVAIRAKGVERSVLITDAVMPAGMPPGPYTLGAVEVELLDDHRVVLRGGDRLAGSSLQMDRGVNTLMQLAGLSLSEAITMATRNPARAGRVAGRLRGLQPGERADVVEFTYDPEARSIEVQRTWLSGDLVYDKESL